MFKKITFLLCSLMIASAFGMEDDIDKAALEQERLENIVSFISEDIFGIRGPNRDIVMRVHPEFQVGKPTREPFFREHRQFELPEESIQKIDAHIEKLQELRRTALEEGDKEKADSITRAIEGFSDRAFGRKPLDGIVNGSAWELGGGIERWHLDDQEKEIAALKPWVKAAKTIKVRAEDFLFGRATHFLIFLQAICLFKRIK